MNYESYKEIIGMVSPYITIIVGLLVIIAKSNLKRLEEKIKEMNDRYEKDLSELFNKKVSKEFCDERHKK